MSLTCSMRPAIAGEIVILPLLRWELDSSGMLKPAIRRVRVPTLVAPFGGSTDTTASFGTQALFASTSPALQAAAGSL